MFRRLLALLLLALVCFVGFGSTSTATATTTSGAAMYTYDARSIASVDNCPIGVDCTATAQLGDAREGSAPPPVKARSTSTTFSQSVVATNTGGARFVAGSDGIVDTVGSSNSVSLGPPMRGSTARLVGAQPHVDHLDRDVRDGAVVVVDDHEVGDTRLFHPVCNPTAPATRRPANAPTSRAARCLARVSGSVMISPTVSRTPGVAARSRWSSFLSGTARANTSRDTPRR